jgi:sugar lactone lactonase YvrE
MRNLRPVKVDGPRSALGECPVWHPARRVLAYLDYLDPQAIAYDERTGLTIAKRLPLRAPLGGLCRRQSGGYLIFNPDGVHLMSDDLDIVGTLFEPHPSFEEAPPNDVCVDLEGRILVATADRLESRPIAGLFQLTVKGDWHQLATGFTIANGPNIGVDGATLYLADSPRGVIYRFDIDADRRTLSGRRTFATLPAADGLPDGLTVDASGCLWSARWGGHSVVRYDPDGIELSRIELPARLVTSCVFGGVDLSVLFITTAQLDSHADNDLGGHLFKLTVEREGSIASPAAL